MSVANPPKKTRLFKQLHTVWSHYVLYTAAEKVNTRLQKNMCNAGVTWLEVDTLYETSTWAAISAESGTWDAKAGLSELISDSIFSASLLQASI